MEDHVRVLLVVAELGLGLLLRLLLLGLVVFVVYRVEHRLSNLPQLLHLHFRIETDEKAFEMHSALGT